MKRVLSILFVGFSVFGFSQTKAELQAQIDKQAKTIDSLKAVVDNQENIIENRDRSIMILKEDVAKGQAEIETLNGKIRQKNTELVNLRNYNKQGEVKKIFMNNTRSGFIVQPGKHIVINQFFADYMTDISKDSLGNTVGKEIHIFLKSMNGTVLTDMSKNMYGPKLYSSMTPTHTIQYPIVITENNNFEIIIFKGQLGSYEAYSGNVICSYYEKAN